MRKKPRTVLAATAVILLGMLLASVLRGQERAIAVTAVRAEAKPIYNSVTANGTVEAEHSYAFAVSRNAAVGEVYCKEGETVGAGQALWRLEPSEEVRWTAEMLQNAVAALAGGEASERVETALAGEPVTVYAPADCTLLSVPMAGQSAPAGLAYAQAVDLNALRLRVDIAEAFVAEVKSGQRANITVSATGAMYAGRVESVAPVAKQAISLTGGSGAVTVSAILNIADADGSLRPGYSANAKIFVDEKESAVILPYEAVRQEGRSEYVYVIGADGRAYRRDVLTGYALSEAVEISAGLAPGDLVVLSSEEELSEGALTEVRA